MSWHRVCELAELVEGQGREFLVERTVVAVFKRGQEVHAIDGMCAHQGGPLAQGQLDQTCLTCPWHGWQYDITSGQNLLTGKKMLDCYPTEVRDTALWIEL